MSSDEKPPTTEEEIEQLGEVLQNLRFALKEHFSQPVQFEGKTFETFRDEDFTAMADGMIERLSHAFSCWEFGDKEATLVALRDLRDRVNCLLIIVQGKDV